MIKISNLSKIYGSGNSAVEALKNVSLQINDGEMVAIIGASGSGKSTLLHILGGLDTNVKSGSVVYDDKDILKLKDKDLSRFRLENIGFVFQFFNLIPELTAEENIRLPQMMCGINKDIPKGLVEKLGISERLKHYPDELSGGQKQRVAIARAVVNGPYILLADEPTGALDSNTSVEIMELFHTLNRDGKTIIIVTHDDKIAKECDKVIEISDGKIV